MAFAPATVALSPNVQQRDRGKRLEPRLHPKPQASEPAQSIHEATELRLPTQASSLPGTSPASSRVAAFPLLQLWHISSLLTPPDIPALSLLGARPALLAGMPLLLGGDLQSNLVEPHGEAVRGVVHCVACKGGAGGRRSAGFHTQQRHQYPRALPLPSCKRESLKYMPHLPPRQYHAIICPHHTTHTKHPKSGPPATQAVSSS